jgi:hypothetical protein
VKRPFHLVQTEGSADTQSCIEAMAEGVKAKNVIGLACVVIYARRNYACAVKLTEAQLSPVAPSPRWTTS